MALKHRPRANGIGLPIAFIHEIHDHLVLALDATESRVGYTQVEREARGYVRAALRNTVKLMEVAA